MRWRRASTALLAAVLAALALPAAARAQAPLASAAEVDYPPFSFVGQDGEAHGFSVELLRAALAAIGREVTFRTGPWHEVRGWLERGEVDALPLVGRTPEREPAFDFTFPYMSLHGAIVVREETEGIDGLDDLRGRDVAVMAGDNAEELLRREERGICIHTTATFEEALRGLSQGRYDAVVIQRLVALRLLRQTGLANLELVETPVEGFRQDFCFAVREGDRDTLALLNEGLAIVVADGTYRHLHSKWFAALQLPAKRRIVIGGDHAYPPFEFLDERGQPAGYNVDLTRAIAGELGLDVEIRLGPWAEIREALARGEVDALQGMFYSTERDLLFDFTQAHTVVHCIAVVREGERPAPSGPSDLAGLRLVVQRGDIMHDYVRELGLGAAVATVETPEQALRELAEGAHDCALVPRLSALYVVERHGWTGLVLGEEPLLSPRYCYAVPNSDRALLAHLSEGLKLLEDSGAYQRIYERWLGVTQEEHPPSFLGALRTVAMVLVPLLAALLLVSAWSWSLRRQVAARTADLEESVTQFRDVFEAANVGKSLTRLTGEVHANRAFADFLGYTPEELRDQTWSQLTAPEDVALSQRHIDALLAGEREATRFEKRYVHKDGSYLWADVGVVLRRDARGEPRYFITTIVDINERRRAEEALRRSEEFERAMIACSPVALYSVDLAGRVLSWNPSAERIFGWSEAEAVGRPLPIVPEERRGEFDALRKHVLGGETFTGRELTRLRKDGALFPISLSVAPIRDEHGDVVAIMGAAEDITARKEAEHALAASEAQYRLLAEHTLDVIWTMSPDLTFTYVNPAITKLTGHTPEEWVGTRLSEHCDEARFEEMAAIIEREVAKGPKQRGAVFETEVLGRDGSPVPVEIHGRVVFDEHGAPLALQGTTRDVSERKRAEAEREGLQAQLSQAQKLEAVGRLAGGVAHDFNNILSVVIGYAELALGEPDVTERLRADLTEILTAARRSAAIVRQLLAFARKQTIQPVVLDLNKTVAGMLRMLRRLIGEDIEIAWRPGEGLWAVKLDPAQVDQILANLCVNARDAISGVGRIAIETGNATFDEASCAGETGCRPGDYVMLAVSDDGRGMDEATRKSIFEPFFTTKDVNQGTGLGLATVYGIVRQNDGFVHVYSEPGRGTTFRIYLPRHAGADDRRRPAEQPGLPGGRGETVLLVEDEGAILELVRAMLGELGYRVLAAATPAEALRLAGEHAGAIALLLTDVVMPGMDGYELSERLRARQPGMRTLYMSGYPTDVIAHRGIVDGGAALLSKPFTRQELAVKVRAALEAGAAG